MDLVQVILILVGVLVTQFVKFPPEPVELEPFATWGSIGLMLLFFALTTWVDLIVGIAVVMFLMSFLWGERRIWVAATVALVTCISIFLLFDKVLEVRFPRGLFTNWYYG